MEKEITQLSQYSSHRSEHDEVYNIFKVMQKRLGMEIRSLS